MGWLCRPWRIRSADRLAVALKSGLAECGKERSVAGLLVVVSQEALQHESQQQLRWGCVGGKCSRKGAADEVLPVVLAPKVLTELCRTQIAAIET